MPNAPVSTITVHANPAGAALTVGGSSDLKGHLSVPASATYRVRGTHVLTLKVKGGSGWHRAAMAGTHLNRYQAVKVTFDGGGVEWWRIESRTIDYAAGGMTVTCWPYWAMLDRRRLRVNRGTYVDYTLAMIDATPAEVLTEIFSHNAPPNFAAGTVHASLAAATVNLEINNLDHLSVLWALCDALAESNGGYPAEFEPRWVGSTCYIDIVPWVGASAAEVAAGYVAAPNTRTISGGTGGEGTLGNRLVNKQTDSGRDYFNRVIPVTTIDPETPVGIGRAEWSIVSAVYDGVGPDTTTITVTGSPLASPLEIGGYFGVEGGTFYTIASVTNANVFKVDGDASSLSGWGRFAENVSGRELVYLGNSEATGDDVNEQVVSFNIAPYRNLVEKAGSSADMSDGWGTLPTGASLIGTPTVTQYLASAYPEYVRSGTSGAHVSGNETEGIAIAVGSLEPTDEQKWHSVSVDLSVLSGRVRVVLVDSDGVAHPQGIEQAESTSKAIRSLQIGGVEAAAGTAYVKIIAQEDSTAFVVDAVAVTRSSSPYPYSGDMGPEALWRLALRYLREHGGSNEAYEVRGIDATWFDGAAADIEIGSYVRLQDGHDGSSYELDETGRVHELTLQYSTVAPVVKQMRVMNARPVLTSRLVGSPNSANVGAAPHVVNGKDYFESQFSALIQGEQIAKLLNDVPAGTYGTLTFHDVPVEIDSGTELQIRAVGKELVTFYTEATLPVTAAGAPGVTIAVSASGGSHVDITLNEDYDADDGVYIPTSVLNSLIYQNAADILLRVTRTTYNTQLGSDAFTKLSGAQSGVVVALTVDATPHRLDDGDKLLLYSDPSYVEITVDGDHAAGVTTVNVVSVDIGSASDDDPVLYTGPNYVAEIKLNADEIVLRAKRTELIDDINTVLQTSLLIDPDKISISGLTTFAPGYNSVRSIDSATPPATRINGDALEVGDVWYDTSNGEMPYRWDGAAWVESMTIIDGGTLSTRIIKSNNWGASAGSYLDLANGEFWFGGSAPAASAYGLSFASGVLALQGDLEINGDYWRLDKSFQMGGATGIAYAGTGSITIGTNVEISGNLSAATGTFAGRIEVAGIKIGEDAYATDKHGIYLDAYNYWYLHDTTVDQWYFSVGNATQNLTFDTVTGQLQYNGEVYNSGGTIIIDPDSGGIIQNASLTNLTITGTLTIDGGSIVVGSSVTIDDNGIDLAGTVGGHPLYGGGSGDPNILTVGEAELYTETSLETAFVPVTRLVNNATGGSVEVIGAAYAKLESAANLYFKNSAGTFTWPTDTPAPGEVLTWQTGGALTWEAAPSGLDADTLDGLDSTQFLRSDVDDSFTGSNLFLYPATGDARLYIRSETDDAYIYLDSGRDGLGGEASGIFFQHDATNKWLLYKDSSHAISLYDSAGASNVFSTTSAGSTFSLYRNLVVDGAVTVGSSTTANNAYVWGGAYVYGQSTSAYLYLDSGKDGLGARESGVIFRDNGTSKWLLRRGTGNNFELYDYVGAEYVFIALPASGFRFYRDVTVESQNLIIDSSANAELWVDRASTSNESRIRLTTALANNWLIRSKPTTSNLEIYSYGTAAAIAVFDYSTASVTINANLTVNGEGVIASADTARLYIRATTDNAYLYLDSNRDGLGGEQSEVVYANNGALVWQQGKNTDNSFRLYDYSAASEVFDIASGGSTFNLYRDLYLNDGDVREVNTLYVEPTTGSANLFINSETASAVIYMDSNRDGLGTAFDSIVMQDDSVNVWAIGKDDSNAFRLYDYGSAANIVYANTADTEIHLYRNLDLNDNELTGVSRAYVNPVSGDANLYVQSETGNAYLRIDSGRDGLGAHESGILFQHDNANYYELFKSGGHSFALYDYSAGSNVFGIASGGSEFTLYRDLVVTGDLAIGGESVTANQTLRVGYGSDGNLVLVNTDGTSSIHFTNTGGITPATAELTVGRNGASWLVATETALKPSGATYDLGASGDRWQAIYTTDLNVSGTISLGDEVLVSSGSAADPSFSFTVEPTTGLFLSSGSYLGFAVLGTEAMTLYDTALATGVPIDLGFVTTPGRWGSIYGAIGDFADATGPQLKLSYDYLTTYATFDVSSSGSLTITPTGDSVTINGGRLKLTDGGASSGLLTIEADDATPWAIKLGNATYGSADSYGLRVQTTNNGDLYFRLQGNAEYRTQYFQQYNGTASINWMTVGASGQVTFADDVSVTGDVMVAAASKLYLDGGSDTYIHESSSNILQIVTGGTTRIEVDSVTIDVYRDLTVSTTGATTVTIEGDSTGYINGAVRYVSNYAISSARALGTFAYDTFGDTEWFWGRPYTSNDQFVINRASGQLGAHDKTSSSAEVTVSRLLTVSSSGVLTTYNDVYVQAGDKIYLDGGSHTYIGEGAADRIDLVAGGNAMLRAYSNRVQIEYPVYFSPSGSEIGRITWGTIGGDTSTPYLRGAAGKGAFLSSNADAAQYAGINAAGRFLTSSSAAIADNLGVGGEDPTANQVVRIGYGSTASVAMLNSAGNTAIYQLNSGATGVAEWSLNSNGGAWLVATNAELRPATVTPSGYSLGHSSYRWDAIYAVDLNLTGGLTLGDTLTVGEGGTGNEAAVINLDGGSGISGSATLNLQLNSVTGAHLQYATGAGVELRLFNENFRITDSGDNQIVLIEEDTYDATFSGDLQARHASDVFISVNNTTTQTAAGFRWYNVGTLKWSLYKDGAAHALYLDDASGTILTLAQGGGATFTGSVSTGALTATGLSLNSGGASTLVTVTQDNPQSWVFGVNSGENYVIRDNTGGDNDVLTLEAGAPDNALYVTSSGALVFGTTATALDARLYIAKTYSGVSGSDVGAYFNFTQDTASTGGLRSLQSLAYSTHTTGTVASLRGGTFGALASGALGTTTELVSVYGSLTIGAGAIATDPAVFYGTATITGTATNGPWMFYGATAIPSYFAGAITVADGLGHDAATPAFVISRSTGQEWSFHADNDDLAIRDATAGADYMTFKNAANEVVIAGALGVANADPQDGYKIDLGNNGPIRAGSAGATSGSLILAGYYSGANVLATLGNFYSSGGTVLGYAVKPKNGASGFVSSAGNLSFDRTAIRMDGDFSVYTAAPALVAIDADVTMGQVFHVSNSGQLVKFDKGTAVYINSDSVAGTDAALYINAVAGQSAVLRWQLGGSNKWGLMTDPTETRFRMYDYATGRYAFYFEDDRFTPAVNNAFDSGSSTYRWRAIYAVDLNLTGTLTLGDEVAVAAGSAADPSYTFTVEPTTGLFLSSGSYLGITVLGTEVVTVLSDALSAPTGIDLGYVTTPGRWGTLYGEAANLATTSGAQLRLAYNYLSAYTDFTTDTSGDLTITPTGGDVNMVGNLKLQGARTFTIEHTTGVTPGETVGTIVFHNLAGATGTYSGEAWITAERGTDVDATTLIVRMSNTAGVQYDALTFDPTLQTIDFAPLGQSVLTLTHGGVVQINGSDTGNVFSLVVTSTGLGEGIKVETADATANNAYYWVQGSDVMWNLYSDSGNDARMILYNSGVSKVDIRTDSASTFSDGLVISSSADISPDASGNGQLEVVGSGYTGYIAMDGTAMYFGHNSASRDLVFQTNETSRLTVGSGGTVTVHNTLYLGNSDTNLYRDSANVLKTDDAFVVGSTINAGSDITITNATPELWFVESGVTADNTTWGISVNAEVFNLKVSNDAYSAGANFMSVQRTGNTVDSITLDAAAFAFDTGDAVFAGSVTGNAGIVSYSGSIAAFYLATLNGYHNWYFAGDTGNTLSIGRAGTDTTPIGETKTQLFEMDSSGNLGIGGQAATANQTLRVAYGSTASVAFINAVGDTGVYLTNTGATLENVLTISSGGASLVYDGDNARFYAPGTDGTFDLGRSDKRWQAVYAVDVNLTGTLTLGNSLTIGPGGVGTDDATITINAGSGVGGTSLLEFELNSVVGASMYYTSGSGFRLRLYDENYRITDSADTPILTITESTAAAVFAGAVTASSFSGSGASLTALNATNLSSGTVASARLSGAYTGVTGLGTLTSLTVSGVSTFSDGLETAPGITFASAVSADMGFWAVSATKLAFVSEGVEVFRFTKTALQPKGATIILGGEANPWAEVWSAMMSTAEMRVDALGKLYLDGGGGSGDTYFHESSANTVQLYTGGYLAMNITASVSAASATFGSGATTSTLFVDTSGNSWLSLSISDGGAGGSSDATISVSDSGADSTTLALKTANAGTEATGLYIDSAQKLWIGSTADTNLYRLSANVLMTDDSFVVGGSLTASGHALPSANATYDLGSSSYAWRRIYFQYFSVEGDDVYGYQTVPATWANGTSTFDDWGHNFNSRAGASFYLLDSSSTGGTGLPAGASFQGWTWEYLAADGTAPTKTQFAIPNGLNTEDGIWLRGYSSSTWGSWKALTATAPDGSATAPGIAFGNDPDTGFYRNATYANRIYATTGSATRFYIDLNGIIPTTTLSLSLGISALRWTDVYQAYADIQSASALALHINRTGSTGNAIEVDAAGTNVAYVTTANGNWTVVSDARFKTHLRPIENALSVLARLSPVTYEWTGIPGRNGTRDAGLIAQDVLGVWAFPVSEGENGFFGIAYDKFVPLLISGVNEVKSEVDRLRDEIATLKERIAALESA